MAHRSERRQALRRLLQDHGILRPTGAGGTEHMAERVGPYVIDQQRRRGRTMTTYHAHHEATGLPVRLAVLHASLAGDEGHRRDFARHARNLALLNHPHLISGVQHGTSDGQPWLVMDRPDGRRLSALLPGEGPVPQDRALRLLSQLTDAISHVHGLGVVHGSVRATTVLLTTRDEAKLGGLGAVDLGHATFEDEDERIAPEDTAPVQLGSGPVDPTRDLHGLGLVLLQLLAGRLEPLHEDPRARVTRDGVRIPGIPTRSLQTDLILWRCLAPERGARFGSAIELAHALERARAELAPAPAPPLRPSTTSTEPLGLETDPLDA